MMKSTAHSLRMTQYELLVLLQKAGVIPEGSICRHPTEPNVVVPSINDSNPIVIINWSDDVKEIAT